MNKLEHILERTIYICAERATVFRFFTDSGRWAAWWGTGSVIDGRAGGAFLIRFPNNITASGEVLEIIPDQKIVFTYGFDSGKPIPPGPSRVTITLMDDLQGTKLTLRHEFADEKARDEHIQGWRYQLALFANVAARDQHADIQNRVDRFFEIWNMTDSIARKEKMQGLLLQDVQFHDMHSCTFDVEDLNTHLQAAKHFMPGLTIKRTADVQLCQGVALAEWVIHKKDNTEAARGTNVFELSPDGRFRKITGFWRI